MTTDPPRTCEPLCPVHGSASCPEDYMLSRGGAPLAGYDWDESMRCGRRPTVCPSASEVATLRAENERLREALRAGAGLTPAMVDAIAEGMPPAPCPAGHGDQCCGYPIVCAAALASVSSEGSG